MSESDHAVRRHRLSLATRVIVDGLEHRQLLAAAPLIVDARGDLTQENYLPQTHTLYEPGGRLTAPSSDAPASIAIEFLRSRAANLGIQTSDVGTPLVTSQYTDAHTGITHVYLQQALNNVPILGATMVVNLLKDGSVISAAGGFLSKLTSWSKSAAAPVQSATSAVTTAAKQLALAKSAALPAISTGRAAKAPTRRTTLTAPTLSTEPINAELRYVPTWSGLSLSWNFSLRAPGGGHWFNVAVDAANAGSIVFANDWTDHASYNVLPVPNESPSDGGFAVVTDPQDPTASPFGWHDTNGVAGAEFADTRGNNVDAHLDRVDDNVPDGTRPSGGASLDFTGASFTQLPGSAPTVTTNQNVAQTNLFYAVNTAHDLTYQYGFTEAAGNFQVNNYGRGGLGGDAVQADAQDGGGTNNANFETPPDGQSPRMQMYLWTTTSPQRDGDLDNSVVFHEFGHGISNRLTGGPANSDALNATQSGGMGEGWSDFFALMFLQRPTDTATTPVGIGTYVLGQSPTALGIRHFPYSYDMGVNPLTVDVYGDEGSAGSISRSLEVHYAGEIWTSALWDLNWLLINKYGYDSNLANGFSASSIKGNTLALQLVMDALKLQPANPSFKDARDAILQADYNLHLTLGTPLNQAEIWSAFARRGMGTGFVDDGGGAVRVTPSFTVPVADPTVTSISPDTTFAPISSIDIRFDQAIDAASFSIADDVLSFTSPGGVDLKPAISSATFVDATTLRLTVPTQNVRGTYTLVLAPTILAADDGNPMDTDRDGTPGEAVDDRYTALIKFRGSLGADGFGYQSAPTVYESLDLVIGDSGVNVLLNGQDDSAAAVNLGANTFNFYGVTYTGGSSLFASTNGLISFGTSNSDWANGWLSFYANQAVIAPLWSDWRTEATAGATDSTVLYRLDTPNNRLIIEWSDVAHWYGTTAATFQAILQLNTGSAPGKIIFNYPDVDVTGYASRGQLGTVGVKAAGTQGANRLLVSFNDVHPWIDSGSAILFAPDVTGPRVVSSAFEYEVAQQFVLTFSEDVGASLSMADITLTNTTTATAIDLSSFSYAYDVPTKTATLTNTGAPLPDGDYTLALSSAGVSDATGNRLDGDSDGVVTGDYAFSDFVLAGDANRDRAVDFGDLLIVAQNYGLSGKTFGEGNFDYSSDGLVNFDDLLILAQQYNASLTQAAPAAKTITKRKPTSGIV